MTNLRYSEQIFALLCRRWSAPFIVFGAKAILFFVFAAVLAPVLMMLRVEGMSLQRQQLQKK